MDIGSVKIAVGISVDLYRGIFSYLYRKGVIPPVLLTHLGIARLEEPLLEVRDPAGAPILLLHLLGHFPNSNNPPDPDTPFDITIRLKPMVVIETIGEDKEKRRVPFAALQIDEVESANPAEAWDFVPFAEILVIGFLVKMKMNVFDKLIAGIEGAYFDKNTLPDREFWAVNFIVAKTATLQHIQVGFPPGHPDKPHVESSTILPTQAAFLATVALPGEDPNMPGISSILPKNTGIQTFVSRNAMDAKFLKDSLEKVNKKMEGATIQALSMRMHDLGIEIHGKAKKSVATITWDGVVLIFFNKFYRTKNGSVRLHDGFINVFTSGMDVDVDLPWYVSFFRAILYFMGPLGWIIDVSLIQPKLKEADKAPDIIRSAFREEVGEAFSEMISNAVDLSDEEKVPFLQFGKDAWVLNGQYTTSAMAFAGNNYDTIKGIQLDEFSIKGASGASVGLINTAKGYQFHPEEAGKLLKEGILILPGYHGVEADWGYYVRSNPNKKTNDNLVDPSLIQEFPAP